MREPTGRSAYASYLARNQQAVLPQLDKHDQPRLYAVLCNEGVAGTNTRQAGAENLAQYMNRHTSARDVRIVEYAPVRIREAPQ